MRIGVTCFECCNDTNLSDAEVTYAALRDDALYTFRCSRGHEHHIVLLQMRFEVLAEVAVQAILDGYYRDAVSSFTASLERFYEFFVQAAIITKHVPKDTFDATWKLVRKQSERQLGMYLALYLLEVGTLPPTLTNDQTKFRNSVVHDGHIPSEEEAILFGQSVIEIVHTVLIEMNRRYRDAVQILKSHHTAEASRPGVGFMSHAMVYELAPSEDQPPKILKDELQRRRQSPILDRFKWATKPPVQNDEG
ncbi:hypothetical protein PMI01_05277 [Caulobacter sp. AP07]|uniref:hypothetical protein n=1 Tax=Caulobacter sp. AP07 TaxID=1144304 RepID=UPI00027225D4|nr:hypothetical protein [Caulobacter sp. AP07]EJL21219.1 hypothetical protein PMI01_05277 [Caulobacter sp. AP07]